jgi:HD superfamily phosphohydrolase
MIINDTVYGRIAIDSSLEHLLNTAIVQRLKQIHQGGAIPLVYPRITTTRFDHSVGTAHLVGLLGGSAKEVVAALLHDISHTAFSHIIDYVLDNADEDFHEKHRELFLYNPELVDALAVLGFEPDDFAEDAAFSLLEADLPALCADRIDYTLRDLIAWKAIAQDEARQFLDSLVVVNGVIAISSKEQGKWFKSWFEFLNTSIFGNPTALFASTLLTTLLQNALKDGTIVLVDFFEDDAFLLSKLEQNPKYRIDLEELPTHAREQRINTDLVKNKLRVVDPPIAVNGKVTPLSCMQ